MKTKIIFIALLSLAFNKISSAQIRKGGFGNLFIGPAFSSTTSLQEDLTSCGFLGDNIQMNKVTLLFGGSGYSIRSSGVVIGGSGFIYDIFSLEPNGEVKFENGAAFFNMGYCIVNKGNRIEFPYLGIGWHRAKFSVYNSTTDKIFVIGNDAIAGNEAEEFKKEGLGFEAGYGLRYFLLDEEDKINGKVHTTTIGMDAGASFFPALQNWKGSTEIVSMKRPFISVVYIRITLGFGTIRE